MARREAWLDPSEGPVESFAHDLRLLRDKSGLTYRQLAARAGYGRTTLSDAANGRDLPTLDVLQAYVGACGGDQRKWSTRWHTVIDLLSAQRGSGTPSGRGVRRDDPALNDLAAEMDRLWIRQVLPAGPGRSPTPRLGVAEQPDAVRDGFGARPPAAFGAPHPLPAGTPLVELFRERFNRRCLVLGAAGSGKTTALLELARDLLSPNGAARDAPVPVMLPLSRWASRTGGLGTWVTEEISEHYKTDTDRIRRWLRTGSLVLLLDGLDEVDPQLRAACVHAINAFRRSGDGSLTGLVVSSRTDGYADLGLRLELGGAVTLQPLTANQVLDRLRADDTLADLAAAFQHDQVLAELLTNPLMLSVAILAYQDRSGPAPTHPLRSRGRREHIFDEYLVRLLNRDRTLRSAGHPAPAAFTPQVTRHSLIWLARLMDRRGATIFYPDWFMPSWLPAADPASHSAAGRIGLPRIAVALTCGVVAGLILATAYCLHALIATGQITDSTVIAVPPGYGIVVGAAGCAAVTLAVALGAPSRVRPLRICASLAMFPLSAGFVHGVLIWRVRGHSWAASLSAALTHAAAFGITGPASVVLFVVLARVVTRLGTGDPARHAVWSWPPIEQALSTAAAVSLGVGAGNGLAYAVTHHRTLGPVYALLFGLSHGLAIGLAVGLAIGTAFALTDLNTEQPAASWHWSARRLGTATAAAAVYGLVNWLLVAALHALVGPAIGAEFGLLVGLVVWLTFALGHGLVPDRVAAPPSPARALSASLRAAIPPTLVVMFLTGLLVAVAARASSADIVQTLRRNITTPTVLSGMLTFWFTGGGVWLAHHMARLTAWKAGFLPHDLLGFLAHAEERQLLRRAGGGYQFLHLALQQHIATENPAIPRP